MPAARTKGTMKAEGCSVPAVQGSPRGHCHHLLVTMRMAVTLVWQFALFCYRFTSPGEAKAPAGSLKSFPWPPLMLQTAKSCRRQHFPELKLPESHDAEEATWGDFF